MTDVLVRLGTCSIISRYHRQRYTNIGYFTRPSHANYSHSYTHDTNNTCIYWIQMLSEIFAISITLVAGVLIHVSRESFWNGKRKTTFCVETR